jgi:hypothetical protein
MSEHVEGVRWRCVYCHDVMARKFRRFHLRMEWMFHRLRAQSDGEDTP